MIWLNINGTNHSLSSEVPWLVHIRLVHLDQVLYYVNYYWLSLWSVIAMFDGFRVLNHQSVVGMLTLSKNAHVNDQLIGTFDSIDSWKCSRF